MIYKVTEFILVGFLFFQNSNKSLNLKVGSLKNMAKKMFLFSAPLAINNDRSLTLEMPLRAIGYRHYSYTGTDSSRLLYDQHFNVGKEGKTTR
jgi:hypothetical protein